MIQLRRLDELESEFDSLLVACLRECARERWGLFGHNDDLDTSAKYRTYLDWPEAKRLKQLAEQIKAIRAEAGQNSGISVRFLSLCSLRGSNRPGEPKLADSFLAEIAKR